MVGIYVHISFTYVILTHNETHSVYKTKIKFHTMHGIYLRCQSRNDLKLTWSMLGLCSVWRFSTISSIEYVMAIFFYGPFFWPSPFR